MPYVRLLSVTDVSHHILWTSIEFSESWHLYESGNLSCVSIGHFVVEKIHLKVGSIFYSIPYMPYVGLFSVTDVSYHILWTPIKFSESWHLYESGDLSCVSIGHFVVEKIHLKFGSIFYSIPYMPYIGLFSVTDVSYHILWTPIKFSESWHSYKSGNLSCISIGHFVVEKIYLKVGSILF
jgi:hypothetical protein